MARSHKQKGNDMADARIHHDVHFDDEQLEDLERRLTIAASRLTPRSSVLVRGKKLAPVAPRPKELQATQQEILNHYRKGVKIASQAESRPLLPLFRAAKQPLPPELQVDHEKLHYDFYTVGVIFSSLLPKDQFLVSAELQINLTDDVKDPARATRPIRLFPAHKDRQYFSIDLEGAVGLSASLDFSPLQAGDALMPFGKATADAELKAGLLLGPIKFQFRKAAIEVIGESDQNIVWRYNLLSECMGTNEVKSHLVLKIAREARQVAMAVSLRVVPCKRKWLVFRDYLPALSDTLDLPVELAK